MTHLRPLALACLSLLPVLQASAYLGGFEQADGYIFGLNYVVTQYNAGQFGLNAGYPGGAYSSIPTGTGLWQKLSGYEYPTPSPATSNFSYAIAHTGYDRATHGTPEGSNLQAMVITTNSNGWNGWRPPCARKWAIPTSPPTSWPTIWP